MGAPARGYTETAYKQEEDFRRRLGRSLVKMHGGAREGWGGILQESVRKGKNNKRIIIEHFSIETKKKKFADIRDTVQLDRQVPSQRLSVREEARGFLEGGARKSSGTVLDGRVRPRNEEARRRDQGRVHRVVLRPRQQR